MILYSCVEDRMKHLVLPGKGDRRLGRDEDGKGVGSGRRVHFVGTKGKAGGEKERTGVQRAGWPLANQEEGERKRHLRAPTRKTKREERVQVAILRQLRNMFMVKMKYVCISPTYTPPDIYISIPADSVPTFLESARPTIMSYLSSFFA